LIEPIVASLSTGVVHGTNYKYVKPPNGPIPCDHVIIDPHVVFDETPPTFIHHSIPIEGNYLSI